MKARVKAKNCKIKVTTYFNEYYLNFNADDVLEIEVDEKVTDFVLLVKRMREAQERAEMITGEEDINMETNFNFKSQICTSRFQSERLLSLGLKKETADMVWLDHALTEDYDDWRSEPIYKDWEGWQKDGIPAWSLHRLIEIMDVTFQTSGRYVLLEEVFFVRSENFYDNVIDCIEWLIKEGYFNKEYLV